MRKFLNCRATGSAKTNKSKIKHTWFPMLRDKYKHGLKYFRLYDREGNTKLENVKGKRVGMNMEGRIVRCPKEKSGEQKRRKKERVEVSSFLLVTYRRYFDTSRFAQIKCHLLPLE